MRLTEPAYANSIGQKFRRIEPGGFLMGNDRPLADAIVRLAHWRFGDPDERPVHRVTLAQPCYFATTPVTNAQFEAVFPEHQKRRGEMGFSADDDEAVVFVTWDDAVAFCAALSERDGLPCRLPTEAEWEFACRAGTSTAFWTGDTLPAEFYRNNVGQVWYPEVRDPEIDHPVGLHVGRTPANPWGLHDMHGLVEEWCLDWYDAYHAHPRTDPAGPTRIESLAGSGESDVSHVPIWPSIYDARVTRGGSHSTEVYYLRSANRSGAPPGDASWYIGFRVVIGDLPERKSVTWPSVLPLHRQNVVPTSVPLHDPAAGETPRFDGPRPYVKIPLDAAGPLFGEHNHDPGFAVCPNGDLMAIWYTCVEERGRELCIAASRRRYDRSAGRLADEWGPPSLFWSTPDKNDHAPALWSDGTRLYHFNGLSAGATWGSCAVILRTSDDSGGTWSGARIIVPEHGPRHMPIASVFALRDGTIVLPCDEGGKSRPGTALWMSGPRERGATWRDAGGTIAGIHAGVVELADGVLLAYGRAADIDGRMAQSVSRDRGATWEYAPSPFPGIRSGQRIVLMRARGACAAGSGPLVLVSFSNAPLNAPGAVRFIDDSGASRPLLGLFAAASFDDGKTWPFVRPLSDDRPARFIAGMDGRAELFGAGCSERRGYCAGAQAQDGTIHVISSWNEYAFNLAWICARPSGG